MDLTERGRFAFDDGAMYCMDTTFLMTGESVKYLCAVLNATLATWFMQNTALTLGMGVARWKRFTVERIPIPKLSASKQRPFVRLVDRILEAKAADPGADTSELEREIDRLVYELYGLTEEEDTAVERALGADTPDRRGGGRGAAQGDGGSQYRRLGEPGRSGRNYSGSRPTLNK